MAGPPDAPPPPPSPPPLPSSPDNRPSQSKPRVETPNAFLDALAAAPPGYQGFYNPDLAHRDGPTWYFFYGTLTQPEVLKHILDLKEEPVYRPAYSLGYALADWGQYKALIYGEPGAKVTGFAYAVQTDEDEEKLAHYETNNYEKKGCMIRFEDGEEPERVLGKTFMYAGDAEALKEGRFDRKLWEHNMGAVLPDSWRS